MKAVCACMHVAGCAADGAAYPVILAHACVDSSAAGVRALGCSCTNVTAPAAYL
jgi:hypothetical protein